MSRTKYLKGDCQQCGGHVEFPAELIGTVIDCPHCRQPTELRLLVPAPEPLLPPRVLIWTGIAVVVLALGLGGALVALNRTQRWAERQKRKAAEVAAAAQPQTHAPPSEIEQTNPVPDNGLDVSGVALEKTPGSSLVYAVGTLKNLSNRQRFGIKVELDLADSSGQKVGTASDYRPVLEPGAAWQFKALVMDSQAASAKISAIKEDQ